MWTQDCLYLTSVNPEPIDHLFVSTLTSASSRVGSGLNAVMYEVIRGGK